MSSVQTKSRVVIIGGGIAGLSAAWYLQQQAAAEYTMLEAGDRWGGKIRTDVIAGFGDEPFIVEGGPDSFITQKPWALQLARELGLDDELLGTNDDQRKTHVLRNGRPVPLPDGVLLIVPTKFMPFALSPLISPLGKLRMGLDLFIPAKTDGEDETLAEFIRRRLGDEALDKIAEPLMTGIYNAEAEKQSLLATFPRFRAIEEKHGSLIRGMVAARRNRPAPSANGKKAAPSVFTSFKGGAEDFVTAIVARLTGDLRLNSPVTGLEQDAAGGYNIHIGDKTIQADAVILAIPSYLAADLVADFAPDAAADLNQIRYVSTGTVSFGFRAADVPNLLPGFGVVVPRSEERPINAVTISSTKFNHRAPAGHILLRVFFGGSRSPGSMKLDDATLLATVRGELASLLDIHAEPVLQRIYRWPRANPQYDVGHLDRLTRLEAALPPGVFVTGSPYRGVGLPDCVHQSQLTVEKVMAGLSQAPVGGDGETSFVRSNH